MENISSLYRTIYTCTPVAFHANDSFFIRDTGLISRTLREMGVESKTIMPLPWHADDQSEYIIRTKPSCLRSASWWRSQGLDAVMLYSWGDPRYTSVARAIHKAGVSLVIQLDFNGAFLRSEKFPRFLRDYAINKLRALHLGYADAISTSPRGKDYLMGSPYYGPAIANKCLTLVTPIAPHFTCRNMIREPRIICVGNWESPIKRPDFLMDALSRCLSLHDKAMADICGRIPPSMQQWRQALPPALRERVQLRGPIPNAELPKLYNASQISLCTSESEGTHNVSAEALCCGCSVVTTNNPERLPMVHWYTSRQSGSIADEDTPEAMAQAICSELHHWKKGERDPQAIADAWSPFFRIDQALRHLFNALHLKRAS